MPQVAFKGPGPHVAAEGVGATRGTEGIGRQFFAAVGVGTMILVAAVVIAIVGSLVAFLIHVDTVVAREATRQFTLHPDLVSAHYAELGTFHSQTASAISQIILGGVLVVVTGVYAAITYVAVRDGRRTSSEGAVLAQQALSSEIRVADALERIAMASEASANRPVSAREIRAAVVLDFGARRTQSTTASS